LKNQTGKAYAISHLCKDCENIPLFCKEGIGEILFRIESKSPLVPLYERGKLIRELENGKLRFEKGMFIICSRKL
jgi:hypothetical protein